MPNNKLTDAEITVKALKEILELMLCDGDLQRTSTISHTIDLINRLQAENERLCKFLDMSRKVSLARRDENIRKDKLMIKMSAELKTAKAEAYKECIEKVKALFPSDNEPYQYWEIHEDADNLLKELVGEDK